MKTRGKVAALLLAVLGSGPAMAHPGGLNAQGCHNNRKNKTYHCHRAQQAKAEPQRAAPPKVAPAKAPEPEKKPEPRKPAQPAPEKI